MRAAPLLVVAGLHGALVLALSPGTHSAGAPLARQALPVRLLPVSAPSSLTRTAPPLFSLPAMATLPTIAPPAFDVQPDARTAAPEASPAAAPAVVLTAATAAATRDEPPTAEPVLQSARRAACAPATHPPLLQERGIEGVVRLRVWVDELGRAGQVLLAASSGWRLFDEAALAQARRCPFQPALRGTQPVGSWVEFPVRFALETSSNG
jgi:protein TonB